MDWIKKLLANREAMSQNGVKQSTFEQLQQFANEQKARAAQAVGLIAVPEMQQQDTSGMAKLGAALGGMAAKSGTVKDDLSGISVDNNDKLSFDQNSIGKLGQEALKDKDNQELLKKLQGFNSGTLIG